MIDLSKLKALELPTKEIEIEILGEKQTTVITALPMTAAVKISTMAEIDKKDPNLPTNVIRLVLELGAKEIAKEDIDMLLDMDYPAAAKIAAEIRDLTGTFNSEKSKTKKEFEKNSDAAKSASGKIS